MKGAKLFIIVLLAAIVFWVGFMYLVSGGLKSWSIADTTQFRWMLGIILFSISRLYWKFADNDIGGEVVLLGNWKYPTLKKFKLVIQKVNIRYKDAFEATGWFFAGVAIFGLGGSGFMQVAHYVVTILAAVGTFLIVVRSSKGTHRILYTVAFFIAAAVWILGFLKITFNIYLGEFLFIIPAIIWIFNRLNNLSDQT